MRRCTYQTVVLIQALLIFLTIIGPPTLSAQEPATRQEFWPELDVYIKVKPKVRLLLIATVSKSVEDGEFRNAQGYEAQVGAHVDFIPSDCVILRTGYRYGTAVGSNDDGFREHRLVTEQTFRKLLPGDVLLSDRNREDFRFINGDFSFRYRNRVTIEREFQLPKFVPNPLMGRSFTPYVSGEVFYDTRYQTWNRNRLTVGLQQSLKPGPLRKMLLPKRQIIVDLYFMRQNDSRSSTPRVNGVGAALSFYF